MKACVAVHVLTFRNTTLAVVFTLLFLECSLRASLGAEPSQLRAGVRRVTFWRKCTFIDMICV